MTYRSVMCVASGLAVIGAVTTLCLRTLPSSLFIAVERGDAEAVANELRRGAQVDASRVVLDGIASGEPQMRRETPLYLACRLNKPGVVRVLLDAGANPDVACTDNDTALALVARVRRESEIARALIEHGADPLRRGMKKRSALEWAASMGSYECFRICFLAARSRLTDSAWSELSQALSHRTDDVRFLIEQVLSAERAGLSPISGARGEFMSVLCRDSQAAGGSKGWCRLHWVCGVEGDDTSCQAMIAMGDDVNVATEDGFTPLMAAVQAESFSRVSLLLQRDANSINASDRFGNTALHIAGRRGLEGIFGYLCDRGGDDAVRNKHGATPRDYLDARRRLK